MGRFLPCGRFVGNWGMNSSNRSFFKSKSQALCTIVSFVKVGETSRKHRQG